jgi:uncharacterized protein
MARAVEAARALRGADGRYHLHSLAEVMRRYPLISFFVIAYSISWTYVLIFLVRFPLPDTLVTDTPMLLGPIAAGFIMSAVVDGKVGVGDLVRRLVLWRVGARWYLIATLGVFAIYLVSVAAIPGAAASFALPSLSRWLLYPILFVVVLLLDGPVLEEPGWRGFALPRLQQRWGALGGAVLLGVLWAAWHGPQYLIPGFAAENGGLSFSGVGVFTLSAVSFSILMTWVFNNTHGSLLIAILMHGALNFSQGLTSDLFPRAAFNEIGPVIALSAVALLVSLRTRGRLSSERQRRAGDQNDQAKPFTRSARGLDHGRRDFEPRTSGDSLKHH